MNNIKLSKMEIRNFKGIKEFTLDIKGLNADIFGENAVGKTTCVDAFLWVVFGKDSANRADFSVKPQDSDGNDVHFLETDVTLELLINGQPKTLRKMLVEKWTRKRGTETDEFTGHETSHWVDTVPVKKKEYMDQINTIIDETAFKLLTNPFYFCTQLKWEDRRKILMEICGDVSDSDVIASSKDLVELTNILNGKSINDQRKIIAERIKKLNKDIESVPIKINELSRTLLSEEVNYPVVEAQLLENKATLRTIEQSMTDASQMAATYRQKQQDLFKLTSAIEDRKKELDAEAMVGLKKAIDEKTFLEGEKYRITTLVSQLKNKINTKVEESKAIGAKVTELRESWRAEDVKQFVEPSQDSFVCPTCEQSLPEGKRQEKINQMRANFDRNKAQILASINKDGKDNRDKDLIITAELNEIRINFNTQEAKLKQIVDRLVEIDEEVEVERKRTFGADYNADPRYSELNSQLQSIKDELNKPIEDSTAELLQQKNEVTEQINSLNKLLNNRDVAIKTQARIDELKAEERTLAGQLSDFEKQRFLIEKFIKAKVNLLEETINNRFKIVKWKLFKTNINGGIEEMCEATVDGVSFNTNLNHAARVNAGIDCINVLAGHYGCTAPIWIDFRESVSRIIDTGSQVINLIKSEPDKVLRVEVV